MKQNAVKEFFSSLAAGVKSIDKKWYPAIGLGAVAVVSAIVVLVFSLTDARNLLGGDGTDTTNPSSAYGADGQVIAGTNENGEAVTYTPEQVSKALDALKDALKNNKGNIKFKNPFANIKLPSGKYTMPTIPKSSTTGKGEKSTTKTNHTTGSTTQKPTEPSSQTTAPYSSQEPATVASTQPQTQE